MRERKNMKTKCCGRIQRTLCHPFVSRALSFVQTSLPSPTQQSLCPQDGGVPRRDPPLLCSQSSSRAVLQLSSHGPSSLCRAQGLRAAARKSRGLGDGVHSWVRGTLPRVPDCLSAGLSHLDFHCTFPCFSTCLCYCSFLCC